MSTKTAAGPPTVQFGSRSSQGVLLGQTGPQLFVEALGLVCVLRLLYAGSWLTRGSWFAAAVLCAAIAFIPVRGRNLIEYMPLYVGHWLRLAAGQDHYRGGVFRMAVQEATLPAPRLPGDLSQLEFLEFTADPAPVAVVKDRRGGTYTAVLALQGSSFALLELDEQHRRVAAYGAMLNGLCREDGVLSRLQILERTLPESGDAVRRDYIARGDRGAPPAARAAYEQLLAAPSGVAQRHETYLAVTMDPSRGSARERISAAGGGDTGAAAVLFQVLHQIAGDLGRAGVTVLGWLPPRGLGYVMRTAFDPEAAPLLDRRGGGSGDLLGGDQGLPSGVDLRAVHMHGQPARRYYRTDSAYHRTFWVTEWPRAAVPSGFLQPLLLNTSHRRAVSLIMEPIQPRRAQREIDVQESKIEAETRWKARIGKRIRRREQAEHDAVGRREAELVQGFGTYRFLGLVSVSAPTLQELDLAAGETLSLAQQSLLEIVPLVHEQDQGFWAASLPLARGLR